MESKLSGVSSWLLAGLAAVVVAVPSISWSVALSNEELRTAYASTSVTSNRQRTIQIGPRDTLWSIARRTRPNNSVTIKQAMLAIRDANPSAFPSSNINEMEMGVRLVIPSHQAMTRRTPAQAEREVRQQNQAWVAGRAVPAEKKTAPKPAAQPKTPVPASMPKQQHLTLVTPKANEAQKQRINDLESDLASSEENLQIAEREKDDLAERISDMQQQVSTLQQLIQLKDKQLTDMEEQLALEQAQPGASRTIIPKAPEAQDLASQIKRQPELYGALAGSFFLLLILFFALLSARKKLKKANQQQTANDAGLTSAFAEDQASSKDFDLDLNAQPLEGLEELEPLDFDDDLTSDLSLDDLGDLDETLETTTSKAEAATTSQAKPKDALEEAETFIAYGRLEQAAGFLQTALVQEPAREDLRIKLLEVLVELNDEETFRHQQQQLAANMASTSGLARAEELAALFVATNTATTNDSSKKSPEAVEEDLGELDLGEVDLNDLDDLDLIFPGEDAADEVTEIPETTFITEADGLVDDSTDDLADIDSLETDLDGLIAGKEPLQPSEEKLSEEGDFGFNEEDESSLENLDLELDLEKPLDEHELTDQGDASTDFEPVDYKSDADDFMQALDSLNLTDEPESATSEAGQQDQQQAPGVDEELAELNENFAELEAFTESQPAVTDDLSDLDDFGDLADLDDLSDLGDQDLDLEDVEGGMNTQLDLATAYIEMGDKEGAREILEKVVREGDADLKATAQQMLETLSN